MGGSHRSMVLCVLMCVCALLHRWKQIDTNTMELIVLLRLYV